jgi:GcrA cell cycle regulator
MSIHQTKWTPEMRDQAIADWKRGLSAEQISRKMKTVSRSAVLGFITRQGLQRRSPAAGKIAARINAPKAAPRPVPIVNQSAPNVPLPPSPPAPLHCEPAPLEALKGHQCRWPMGERMAVAELFCGAMKERGSYCGFHAGLAYSRLPNGQKPDAKTYERDMRRYA